MSVNKISLLAKYKNWLSQNNQVLYVRSIISLPQFWLGLFLLLPVLIVVRISFSDSIIASPPYSQLFTYIESHLNINLSLVNYKFLVDDSLYINAYFSSVVIAFISSLLCLLIGYPMAYTIARSNPLRRNMLLLLVILPFWTSFLIRVYAWIEILNNNGLINQFVMFLGIIDEPWTLRGTYFSLYLGMTYSYLPLMILPLYANFIKLEKNVLEASADLGSKQWQTFLFVIFPLSKPGVIAGFLLVFIPAVGEFVIPTLLGSSRTLMIGKVLWDEFFSNRDWPLAATVTVILLIVLMIPLFIGQHYSLKKEVK